jgi:hypothetical protein
VCIRYVYAPFGSRAGFEFNSLWSNRGKFVHDLSPFTRVRPPRGPPKDCPQPSKLVMILKDIFAS